MSDFNKIDIEQWYQLYSDAILKYILMMVRDYQQAEDLTQETFVRAFQNYHSFEQRSQVKTWLFRIAHNVTVDYLRKKKPLRMIESFLYNKRDTKALPEDVLDMKENAEEVYYALGKLKQSYREVIILRKIKGFSVKETSGILSWSENKVKTTLHRAMYEFKNQLMKEGYSYEKQHDLEELDQILEAVDEEISWSDQHKTQLKQRTFKTIESKKHKRFSFPVWKYSFSLIAVGLLIFMIFVPVWNNDESSLFNQQSSVNADGIGISLSHVEEQSDGSMLVRLDFTNDSKYSLVRNEVFVKKMNGVFNDSEAYLYEDNDWSSRIDPQSKILDVNVLEGSFDTIEPTESAQIEFLISPEFVDTTNYQLMLQNVKIKDNYGSQIAIYQVIDLDEEKIVTVIDGNEVPSTFVQVLLFLLVFAVATFIIIRFVKSVKRKSMLVITTCVLLIIIYFVNIAMKDDITEIEKELKRSNQPMTEIVHVEFIDNRHAIAFYEWGAASDEYFGTGLFRKGLTGWQFNGGSTSGSTNNYEMHWSLSNLSNRDFGYTVLLKGKIYNPEIKQVRIVTETNQEYEATVHEYNNGESFYYFLSNDKDLAAATVLGLSKDGDVVEQVNRR